MLVGLHVGSIPTACAMRVSYNGITLAFQAREVGSIPTTRSNFYVGSSAVERRSPKPNVEGSIPSRRAMRV